MKLFLMHFLKWRVFFFFFLTYEADVQGASWERSLPFLVVILKINLKENFCNKSLVLGSFLISL